MTYTIDMLIDKIKEVGKSYDLDKIQAAYELESLILRTL